MEKISRMSCGDFVHDNLLSRLGMRDPDMTRSGRSSRIALPGTLLAQTLIGKLHRTAEALVDRTVSTSALRMCISIYQLRDHEFGGDRGNRPRTKVQVRREPITMPPLWLITRGPLIWSYGGRTHIEPTWIGHRESLISR